MRHFAIATVAAAALLSTSAFAAGVPSNIEQQNAAVSSVRVQGGQADSVHRYKVSQREFATQFNGTYKLTNGSELELRNRGARYYASVDGSEVELVSVTPNMFVSVDSKMAVSFDKDATGGDDVMVRTLR